MNDVEFYDDNAHREALAIKAWSEYSLKFNAVKEINKNENHSIQAIALKLNKDFHQVNKLLKLGERTVSYDVEVNEEGRSLLEFIPDAETVQENVMEQELKEKIVTYISTLGLKQREVMTQRFGLNGGEPKTLDEIGSYLKLSKERIRQIEAKILSKLKIAFALL